MKRSLVGTTLWAAFEAKLLSIIWWIDRRIIPNFHTHFMRFLHGKVGSKVIPSTIQLECSHSKRNWNSRTKILRVNKEGTHDPKGRLLRKGDLSILPTEEVLSLLMRSKYANTIDCFCREHRKKHGKECEIKAPLKTCMAFYFTQNLENIRDGEPKPKNEKQKEHLYNFLKKMEKIGLVHQVIWSVQNNTYVVCNCCPCCCEVLSSRFASIKEIKYHEKKINQYNYLMKKIAENGRKDISQVLNKEELDNFKVLKKKIKYHTKAARLEPTPITLSSSFVSKNTNIGKCQNCGICEKRCYFGSRVMKNGKMYFNPELCTGCGLCVTTCPAEVIQLVRRDKVKRMDKKGKGIKHMHPHKGIEVLSR
jgi:ferredoxin